MNDGSTRLYNVLMGNPNANNAIGRTAGLVPVNQQRNDNFFTKRARSIENAIGTTLAAPASFIYDSMENAKTDQLRQDNKNRMNDVAKKYGYNSWSDWQDAYYAAKEAGDTAKVAEMQPQLQEFQAQANANADKAKEKSDAYADYRNNNYISQKINQDRGKFAGSAMNTLSTGFDIMSMAAGIPNGPIINGLQGAWEGVADELEQNGGLKSENVADWFDPNKTDVNWEQAGKNAAIGAASGLATGALNKTNLVKNLGQGKISQAILGSKLGQKVMGNGLARGAQAIGVGAARGALSGAVGGATGAGLSAAMNNQDIMSSALQGAAQGAKSGALTGSIMAGATTIGNAALNKLAPDMMDKVRANQARNAEYGDTLREQWKGAWSDRNNTDAALASSPMAAITTDAPNESTTDGTWRDLDSMVDRSIAEAMPGANVADVKDAVLENVAGKLQNSGIFDDYEAGRISDADYRNYAMAAINDSVSELSSQPSTRPTIQTQIASDNTQLSPWDKVAQESGYASYDDAIRSFQSANPDVEVGTNDAGKILTWMDENPGNWNPNATRTTTMVEQEQPRAKELTYGDSTLGSKKKTLREKVGLALERSQVNATRKEMRDIGIENAGELVDNVRRRTGLIDLDEQAQFAKEVTGGKNSLLDTIQNDALSTNDDGSTRMVDLTVLDSKIRKIVDNAPDTLVSASKKQEILSGIQRELTNPGVTAVQKANDMRASASELYTKNAKTPDKADVAEGKIYSEVAGLVEDEIYNAIPEKKVDWMYDKAIAESNGRAQQLANAGNKEYAQAYTNLANDLATTDRTIKNYRSLKKDFVDVNKLATKTSQGSTAWNNNNLTLGTAVTAAALSGNPLTAIPVAAATKLLAPAVGEVTTKGAAKLGGKLVDWGRGATSTPTASATTPTTYNPATQVYNMIGRDAGERQGEEQRVAQYLTQAQDDQTIAGNTLEGLVAPLGATTSTTGTGSTSVYNSVYGAGTPRISGMSYEEERAKYFYPPTGDYWTDMLSQAMRNAKNAEDYDALGSLYEMYMDAVAKNTTSSTSETKLTDKQRQANAAARALDALEGAENNFGYDVSNVPVLGWAANLTGNDYKSKAEALALQVGYMLSGATINRDEAIKIGQAYVPQPMESQEKRQEKLERLRGIISDYQRTYAE